MSGVVIAPDNGLLWELVEVKHKKSPSELDLAAHNCNPSIRRAEAGDSKFQVSLGS